MKILFKTFTDVIFDTVKFMLFIISPLIVLCTLAFFLDVLGQKHFFICMGIISLAMILIGTIKIVKILQSPTLNNAQKWKMLFGK